MPRSTLFLVPVLLIPLFLFDFDAIWIVYVAISFAMTIYLSHAMGKRLRSPWNPVVTESTDFSQVFESKKNELKESGFSPVATLETDEILFQTFEHEVDPIQACLLQPKAASNQITSLFTSILDETDLPMKTSDLKPVYPKGDGEYSQSMPGANIFSLLERHRSGMKYLVSKGLDFTRETPTPEVERVRSNADSDRVRERFSKKPLYWTILMLLCNIGLLRDTRYQTLEQQSKSGETKIGSGLGLGLGLGLALLLFLGLVSNYVKSEVAASRAEVEAFHERFIPGAKSPPGYEGILVMHGTGGDPDVLSISPIDSDRENFVWISVYGFPAGRLADAEEWINANFGGGEQAAGLISKESETSRVGNAAIEGTMFLIKDPDMGENVEYRVAFEQNGRVNYFIFEGPKDVFDKESMDLFLQTISP